MDGSDDTTGSEALPPEPPRYWTARWGLHLALLTLYPIILGIVGVAMTTQRSGPVLPGSVSGLLIVSLQEVSIFLIVFGLAWGASRANARDLLLRWHSGFWFPVYGFVYSLALRVALAVLTFVIVVVVALVADIGLEGTVEKMRPRTEVLVDAEALRGDPIYLALSLTLISFVVAGLREELWRAGMLAGMEKLFPNWLGGSAGKMIAICITALVFGLGHLPQGWVGVALTTFLGVGLGAIMVIHRSIWPAVIAHGFFNAASFAAIYKVKDVFPSEIPLLW